jgi:hypothetical protein
MIIRHLRKAFATRNAGGKAPIAALGRVSGAFESL